MTRHPSEDCLIQLASGDVADEQADELLAHLEACNPCNEIFLRSCDKAGESFERFVQRFELSEVCKPTERFSLDNTPSVRRLGIGAKIGSYVLREVIGEGGMGVVYAAEQERPIRRKVALKIIKPGMQSSQFAARFAAERQALALMNHDNIAKVLDAGTTTEGDPYFVMDLVYGVEICSYCDEYELSIDDRLRIFISVCGAIEHAHQKGIIHRDIKPSNVLVSIVDGRPQPKVIDFGIAKATQQKLTDQTMYTHHGQVLGTFQYMSPEQALNQLDVDTRTDVYALGVLLFELLTGSTPLAEKIKNASPEELLRTIREQTTHAPSARIKQTADSSTKIADNRRATPYQLFKIVSGEP